MIILCDVRFLCFPNGKIFSISAQTICMKEKDISLKSTEKNLRATRRCTPFSLLPHCTNLLYHNVLLVQSREAILRCVHICKAKTRLRKINDLEHLQHPFKGDECIISENYLLSS